MPSLHSVLASETANSIVGLASTLGQALTDIVEHSNHEIDQCDERHKPMLAAHPIEHRGERQRGKRPTEQAQPEYGRKIAQPKKCALGIAVHDHIIVGKDGHASLKGLRLI
jgi:hypothetical protein